MAFNFLKKKDSIDSRKKAKAFDANNSKIKNLKLLICIVKKGHGVATNQTILDNGANMSTILYAEGTVEKYMADIFASEEKNKEVIISLVADSKYEAIKEALDYRFSISYAAKGIMLALDIKSMAGVLAYKFLTDYEGAKKYAK